MCIQVGGGPTDPNQPTSAFRIPWGVQMLPGVILFIGLFFFPYSPRWLASKDRWEEALQVLASIHGNGDVNHPKVLAQYQEIEEALRFEREQAISSYKALVARGMFKRVFLGMSVQTWSQLCGMNISELCRCLGRYHGDKLTIHYSDVLYCLHHDLGKYWLSGKSTQIAHMLLTTLTEPPKLLTASIQYIINVAMTLPAILFLDKWGRRPSLVIGAFLMMTWLFISGALQQYYGQANTDATRTDSNKDVTWLVLDNKPVSSAIVACSYLFVATFAMSWGPVSWTYPAEIFPSKIRAKAVSLTTSANWFWNMVLAFAVPPLLTSISYKMVRNAGKSPER